MNNGNFQICFGMLQVMKYFLLNPLSESFQVERNVAPSVLNAAHPVRAVS